MRLQRELGLTLLELLIALALGVSLMGMALGVLLHGRQQLLLAREVAQLQESARFLLDFLGTELRHAGYSGCSSATPLVRHGASSWYFERPGVQGYDYAAGRSSFPTEFRSAVRADNDALALRYGAPLRGAPTKGQALLVVAPDCTQLALGQWQQDIDGGDVAGLTPLSLESAAYYVGSSNSASGVPALFRERLAVNGTTQQLYTVAEELVPGVEALRLRYGLDGDGDGHVDRHVRAHEVEDWTRVLSVQLHLSLRSITAVQPTARPYTLPLGQGTPSDRHLHQVFTTTIALRNH